MKNLFLSFVIAFSIFGMTGTSFAQTKIGYINTDELIAVMPEARSADSLLQDYQQSLQEQGNKYVEELREKDSLFVKDSATLSAAKKELRSNELFELYQKVQGWNQTMQQKMNEKQQTILVPIRNKAMEAIKAVAKEKGYAYILDANALVVSPPADDVLPFVKSKLGIKDTPAKPGAAKATP